MTQNAQTADPPVTSQTRSHTYDGLGRLTSEQNPETGGMTYVYDTDATCGTSSGDLVKRADAVGNTTCYAYDALHRVTSVTYSGPYAPNTPNKYFVYDAATVNGVAMANARNRLAEAYTATSRTGTKITDTGFSYSVRGEIADVYQSTPQSGGYYHTAATYWANGAVNQLSSLAGLPAMTYGVDGEGRPSTVSAGSGQNPVTSTTYNVASQPTEVNLGSLDSDAFSYDANTGRMTQYKFTVNGQALIGNPGWNSNGRLRSLLIADPFNSSNTQSCTYLYDDLARIQSADCGSTWGQTFSYDAFGNISKSGSMSFQPTYSPTTNRMTLLPGGFVPSYDANGNVTNDSLHIYTWDAEGRPVTIDAVSLTYDALGRMVEQNRSGAYTEIVYAPTGSKLALMSGQSLQQAFVGLPAGATAVYNSGGLNYYRHPDWLGSSRFASTPTRTMYADAAYAPFGEPYAQAGATDLSFTGQNQDTAGGLYDFLFREYSIQGRWPSPDPAGLAAVARTNPQSLNRYAYVLNDPLNLTDPLGLCNEDQFRSYEAYLAYCGGGGGGGSLGCTLDGVAVPCDMASRVQGQRAAVAVMCPNNDCVGAQVIGNQVFAWVATRIAVFGLTCSGTWNNPTAQCSPLAFNTYTYILAFRPVGSVADWNAADGLGGPSVGSWEYTRAALGTAGDLAGQAVDPRTIAVWYGGSALVGAGGWALLNYGPAGWGWTLSNGQNIAACAAGALSPTPGGPGFWGNTCSLGALGVNAVYDKLKHRRH